MNTVQQLVVDAEWAGAPNFRRVRATSCYNCIHAKIIQRKWGCALHVFFFGKAYGPEEFESVGFQAEFVCDDFKEIG